MTLVAIAIPFLCFVFFIIGVAFATVYWCVKLKKYSDLLNTANAQTRMALDVAEMNRSIANKNLSNLNKCIQVLKDQNAAISQTSNLH